MKFVIETWADNPVLRTQCTPVMDSEWSRYAKIGKQMVAYIKNPDNGGIGLAAPQIGITKRMIVCWLPEKPDDKHYQVVLMVNPEILEFGPLSDRMEEWCLSLPEMRWVVERPTSIKISYQDEKGKKCIRTVVGYGARVVQHEVDHINGVLFIDKSLPPFQSEKEES